MNLPLGSPEAMSAQPSLYEPDEQEEPENWLMESVERRLKINQKPHRYALTNPNPIDE